MNSVEHTHLGDSGPYVHSHKRGEVPHGHHGSRYARCNVVRPTVKLTLIDKLVKARKDARRELIAEIEAHYLPVFSHNERLDLLNYLHNLEV